jgi:hypothetical protein
LKRYDEKNDTHIRQRSSDNSPDISFVASSSLIQPVKYRCNTQLNDYRHQPKIFRTQSRIYSSSSIELTQPSTTFSTKSSNETSDNDDDSRRKSLKTHQSIRESPSPTLRYASNGVLLRTKHHHQQQQQQHSINTLQTPSNDMNKKFKRFSLDQQQTSEPSIYRSSMAIVPNHAIPINNNHNTSLIFKQVQDESNNDLQQQQRAKVKKK